MFNQNTKAKGKDELPEESLTEYYEDRKKLIFKKLTIEKDEEYILGILKKSQLKVNNKLKMCKRGGFFSIKQQDIYWLSAFFKENIANYSLVFTLYFQANKNLDALKLFLLMSEQNKKVLEYLIFKEIEQLPKISNTNKIAVYYPTITKTLLQVLSLFIKLAGKFNKSILENYYIKQYLRIVHLMSYIVIKYVNPGKIDELNNSQFKNERKYFYSQCLFDCSIYLFNRFQPLSTPITILLHILELYNSNVNYLFNELELTLLLKINYNLALFYYVDGFNSEAISNMNQAKERLNDIKYFPKTRKTRISLKEEDLMMNKLRNNNNNDNSTFLLDINDVVQSKNEHISRNKFQRSSIRSGTHKYDKETLELQSTLYLKATCDSVNGIAQPKKKKFKQYSTIFIGAYNILRFKNPIELEIVQEKILNEIELIMAEIEINNKNFKESLNHINFVLNLQRSDTLENSSINKEIILLTKSKTNSTQNEADIIDKKSVDKNNRFILNYKRSANNDNSLFLLTREKSGNNLLKDNLSSSNNNNNSTINHNIPQTQSIKYHLTNSDKSRINHLLEEIEKLSWENDKNISKNKLIYQQEESKYNIDQNKIMLRSTKNIASKEMEKFFIFICGLSIYQLKILNDTQPPPSRRRNDLPIIFNNQFQDCLTNSQRMTLSLLETMSLSRYVLLKDANKDISLDNLDYRFMLYRIKEKETEEKVSNKINDLKKKLNRFKRSRNMQGLNKRSNTLCVKGTKNVAKKIEMEEDNTQIKYFMKNNSLTNKKLISSHRKTVLKFMDDINSDEQKIFYKNPELLTKIISSAEKDLKKKKI